MDSHEVLLAATYLLGTLGESLPPGTARQSTWAHWGAARGSQLFPGLTLGPLCIIGGLWSQRLGQLPVFRWALFKHCRA